MGRGLVAPPPLRGTPCAVWTVVFCFDGIRSIIYNNLNRNLVPKYDVNGAPTTHHLRPEGSSVSEVVPITSKLSRDKSLLPTGRAVLYAAGTAPSNRDLPPL